MLFPHSKSVPKKKKLQYFQVLTDYFLPFFGLNQDESPLKGFLLPQKHQNTKIHEYQKYDSQRFVHI